MTSVIHPERVSAYARGDLAERMVYVAWGLAGMVRDEGAEAIGEFLDTLTPAEKDALLIVQAAMIPADESTPEQLLAFVTWDEFGYPLADAGPLTAPAPVDMAAVRIWKDCGTNRAFSRHRRAGHSRAQAELCGCAQAERDYRNARYADRKDGDVAAQSPKTRTEAKVRDYAELRGRDISIGEAAERLGISERTAHRYEARLKAAKEARVAA